MSLLSTKDYNILASAMRRGEEIVVERTLGSTSVVAKTCRVAYPWQVPMIVQVWVTKGGLFWVQNFESVEEARRNVDV